MHFRARQHIRRPADFAAVRKEGRRLFGAAFVFSWRRRSPDPAIDLPRFAVVASRRVGSAVVRNRLKRQIREIWRHHQHQFPAELDVIITLRPGADQVSFAELEQQFLRAARRAGFSPAPDPSSTSDHGNQVSAHES